MNNKLHIHYNSGEKNIITQIRFWGQCHGDLHRQEPNLIFRYKIDPLASATMPDLQIRMKKQINDPYNVARLELSLRQWMTTIDSTLIAHKGNSKSTF